MQKRWLSGEEIINRWNILPFELLGYCKMGLQPYNKFGKKIINIDSVKNKSKFSYQNVEKYLREKAHDKIIESFGLILPDVLDDARKLYEALLKHDAKLPYDCILISFNVPENEKDAENVINDIYTWLFKCDEVKKFEKEHNISPPTEENHDKAHLHVTNEKITDLLKRTKLETEMIYSEMKDKIGFSAQEPNLEKKLQQTASSYFSENREKFDLIKEDHIKDKSIYVLNSGHSKRDFIGRLLCKIVEENNLGKIGGQKLYKMYNCLKD